MSTRSRAWTFRRRVKVGSQFFTTGPAMDPATVQPCADRLELREGDPPVYLEVIPPFSSGWVKRLEQVGALRVTEAFRAQLDAVPTNERRRWAWRTARAIAAEGRRAGFAGIVLMGLKFETVAGEAYDAWHDTALAPA